MLRLSYISLRTWLKVLTTCIALIGLNMFWWSPNANAGTWLAALNAACLLLATTAIAGVRQTLRRMLGTEPSHLVSITHEIAQGNLNPVLSTRQNDHDSVASNIAVMLEKLRANQAINLNGPGNRGGSNL